MEFHEMSSLIFNYVVLKKVFTFLPVGDICNSRLVCRTWNDAASPVLDARQVTIQFQIPEFDSSGARFRIYYQNFLEMMEKSRLKFTSFSFSDFPLYDTFFAKYGKSIRKLRINYWLRMPCPRCQWHRTAFPCEVATCSLLDNLRDILLNKALFLEELEIEHLPGDIMRREILDFSGAEESIPELKLRRLKVRFPFHSSGSELYSENFFVDLLKASKNLTDISVRSNRNCSSNLTLLLQSMVLTERIENLTVLNLKNIPWTPNCASIIENLNNFNITRLRKFITPEMKNINWQHLETFLRSQSESLEYLAMWISSDDSDYRDRKIRKVEMPKMKNLKVLKVYPTGRSWENPISLGQIQYSEQFPKLEKLKLYGQRVQFNTTTGNKHIMSLDAFQVSELSQHYPNLNDLEEIQATVSLDDEDYSKEELFLNQVIPCSSLKYLTLCNELYYSPHAFIYKVFPNICQLKPYKNSRFPSYHDYESARYRKCYECYSKGWTYECYSKGWTSMTLAKTGYQ